MNRVKQLSIVLLTLAVITSAIYGPGAFTSLSADRQSNVDVVGDADAYIGLEPADGPNGAYAIQEDGDLRLTLDDSIEEGRGAGLNDGALTAVENVFTISNNGAGPVAIWLENDQEGITFENSDDDQPIESDANAVVLEPGETVPIGLYVDTRAYDLEDDPLEQVQIRADSDVEEVPGDDDWEGDAEEPDAPDEDEFFAPTDEAEDTSADAGPVEKTGKWLWNKAEKAYEGAKNFKEDPLGWMEDQYDWATGLKDDLKSTLGDGWEAFQNGTETLIEDRSISGVIDSVTDTVIDAGGDAVETIREEGDLKEFLAGFAFGEMGMPDGFLETELNDSGSYLFGYISGALTPGWGFISDTQALVQNVANGEFIEAAIDAASLVLSAPTGGGDPAGAVGAAQSWASAFSISKVSSSIVTELIPRLPGETVSVRILDQFTDGKKASQLNDVGLSDEQIATLMESGKLEDVDPKQVEQLVESGVPPNQIVDYVEEGSDLRKLDDSNRIVTDGGVPRDPSDAASHVGKQRGYTKAEVQKLETALKAGEDVGYGPGKNTDEVIERLSDPEVQQIKGYDGLTTKNFGKPKDGYKQVAGESDIAQSVLKQDGVKAEDLKFGKNVDKESIPENLRNKPQAPDGAKAKKGSEVDVAVEGELTVTNRVGDEGPVTLDSPAMESKHWKPRNFDGMIKGEQDDLAEKLTAQAASDEVSDDLVVVTTEDYISSHGDQLESVEEQVKKNLRSGGHGDDVRIAFTTYEDLK